MKRLRLSTLLLLVVIAAMILGLVVQQQRANRREAVLVERRAVLEDTISNMKIEMQMEKARSKSLADQLEATKKVGR